VDTIIQRATHALEVLDELGDPIGAAEAAAAVAGGMTNATGDTAGALALVDERLLAVEGLDGSEVAVKRLLESKVGALLRRGEPADDAAEDWLRMVELTGGSGVELVDGYVGLGIYYAFAGPQALSLLLFEAAASAAREGRDPIRLARALANLAGQAVPDDVARGARIGADAMDAARTSGSKRWSDLATVNYNSARLFLGDWDDVLTSFSDDDTSMDEGIRATFPMNVAAIALARGEPVLGTPWTSPTRDNQLILDLANAQARAAASPPLPCGELVVAAVRDQVGLTLLAQDLFLYLHIATETLLVAGDTEAMAELVAVVEAERSRMPRSVRGELRRLKALLATAQGDDAAAERLLRGAIDDVAAWGSPVLTARYGAELAGCLVRQGRPEEAEPYVTAARASYEGLGAQAWLRQLEAAELRPVTR
jgi:hypothetical protein